MPTEAPGFSRLPPPIPLAMSSANDQHGFDSSKPGQGLPTRSISQSQQPTPSPIPPPVPAKPGQEQPNPIPPPVNSFNTSPRLEPCRPFPKHWPSPRLRFQCHDVSHRAAELLFEHNNPTHLLRGAIDIVLSTLYSPSAPTSSIPPVKSITLVMREMDGVAYTTGNNELGDQNHKEIHFNLNHIINVGPNKARMVSEIRGVFVHEMVHCWQWNGNGQGYAPGGLIEGIADWVRLKAGFAPPHWKKESKGKWDEGYQHTAYFLEWAEGKYGEGKVVELNGRLQGRKYEEGVWVEVFGKKVGDMFEEYKKTIET